MAKRIFLEFTIYILMAAYLSVSFGQKNSDFIVKHLKFQIFTESNDGGKLAWNGEQAAGTLTLIAKGTTFEAIWEFVRVTPWENGKKVQLIPWVCSSQPGPSGSQRIYDLKFDGKQISFFLQADLSCKQCALRFTGTAKRGNDFTGSGLHRNYGDNTLKKIEYWPVREIQMSSNIVN
jgi:hypothetical protein